MTKTKCESEKISYDECVKGMTNQIVELVRKSKEEWRTLEENEKSITARERRIYKIAKEALK
ncbi:hypothetical protein [Bacillus altitudinis]|uniref:hypothetical protein n=1 Tax=Bacillus altitudinis TaxID=293387 RepID=UPI00345A8C91